MRFDTVAIVGVGLIGGSIGLALRRRRLARRVVGIGRRRSSLAEARRRGALDSTSLELRRGVADAELTVFCTPVGLIADQAIEAADYCPAAALLTDAGSTKRVIVERLEGKLSNGVTFVGSHPLAGSEKRGPGEARADLFDGRICVVTRTERTPTGALNRVRAFWRSLGAKVVVMDPVEHDRALAYTSHLPHLAAAALCSTLPHDCEELTASGFRDATRIAAGEPSLWTGIFLQNRESVLTALSKYQTELDRFARAVDAADESALTKLLEGAKLRRDALGS